MQAVLTTIVTTRRAHVPELSDAIRSRLDDLQEQVTRAGGSLAAMHGRVAELQAESTGLRDEQGRLHARIAELEAENGRIRHLQAENDQVLARHAALSEELRAMLGRMQGDG